MGLGLMKTGREQPSHDHAVKHADERVACQRARAGPATGEPVSAKTDNGAEGRAQENPQYHNSLSLPVTFDLDIHAGHSIIV